MCLSISAFDVLTSFITSRGSLGRHKKKVGNKQKKKKLGEKISKERYKKNKVRKRDKDRMNMQIY